MTSVAADVPGTMCGAKVETGPPVTNAGVGPPGTAPTGAGGGAHRRASRRLRHPRAAITNTSATAYPATRYTHSHHSGSTRVL